MEIETKYKVGQTIYVIEWTDYTDRVKDEITHYPCPVSAHEIKVEHIEIARCFWRKDATNLLREIYHCSDGKTYGDEDIFLDWDSALEFIAKGQESILKSMK